MKKKYLSQIFLSFLILAVVTLVSGCGSDGGSGHGESPTPTNKAPVITSVTVNPQTVSGGQTAEVIAIANDPDGDVLTYEWTADAGTFSSTTTATTQWTAPETGVTAAKITLKVKDGKGGEATKIADVTVIPIAKASITGKVADKSGPVEGATVSVTNVTTASKAKTNGLTTTTDSNGIFKIFDVVVPDSKRVNISIEKQGKVPASKIVEVTSGRKEPYSIDVSLADYQAPPVSVDTTQAKTIDVSSGGKSLMKIDIPANPGFKTASGKSIASKADGTPASVTMASFYGDPTTEEGLKAFPGDFVAKKAPGKSRSGKAGADETVYLESIAFTDISVKDSSGEKVTNMDKPVDVTLRLPDELQPKYKEGDKIPWWSYSETEGIWVREDADPLTPDVLDNADVIKGEDGFLYAKAKAYHFSWWNCDQPIETWGKIKVRVVKCGTDEPIPNIQVTAEGKTYNGTSYATTDSNGIAEFTVKNSSAGVETVDIYIMMGDQKVAEYEDNPVQTPPDNQTILDLTKKPICLDLGKKIEGKVSYKNNQPVKGCPVTTTLNISGITGEDGKYSISIPKGTDFAKVHVSVPGASPIQPTVTSDPDIATANFSVGPEISYIYVASGSAIQSGAKVQVYGYATPPYGNTGILKYEWSVDKGSKSNQQDNTYYSVIDWTAPADSGEVTFKLKVTDAYGGVSEKDYKTKYGNEPPVLYDIYANPGTKVVNGKQATLSSYAYDPNNDALIYKWTGNGIPSEASSSTVIWTAPETGTGAEEITLTVSDGKAEVSKKINLEYGENTLPVIDSVFAYPAGKVANKSSVWIYAYASDNNGYELKYAWKATAGTPAEQASKSYGSSFNWTAPDSGTGTAEITVTVEDPDGGKAEKTIQIEYGPNEPPVINDIYVYPGYEIAAGQTASISVYAQDPQGIKNYEWKADKGIITGGYGYATWTAPSGETGEATITITAFDYLDAKTEKTIKIKYVKNDPPVITSLTVDPQGEIIGGTKAKITVAATDPQGIASYKWKADKGTITGSGSSVDWQAPTGETGEATITVTVADTTNLETSKSVKIKYVKPNAVPVITSSSPASPVAKVDNNGQVAFTVAATDADNDQLTYEWKATSGAPASGTGTEFNWTAPATGGGTAYISVTVKDGKGGAAVKEWVVPYGTATSGSLKINVKGADNKPSFGVYVILYKQDGKTIEKTIKTDIDNNGVADFGEIGRDRVTVTIASSYERTVESGKSTYRNLNTLVNFKTGAYTYYNYDGSGSDGGDETCQTPATIGLNFTGLNQGETPEITPYLKYNNETQKYEVCTEEDLQDDGKMSFLASYYTYDMQTYTKELQKYGVLIDQTVENGKIYTIDVNKTPANVSWSASEPLTMLNLSAMRKGYYYSLGSIPHSYLQTTPPSSGQFKAANPFTSDTTYNIVANSFVKNQGQETGTTKTIRRKFDSFPGTLENILMPNLNVTSFTYNYETGTFQWAYSGTMDKDLLNLSLAYNTSSAGSSESVCWNIFMSGDRLSFDLPELPQDISSWFDRNKSFYGSLMMHDYLSINGFDDAVSLYVQADGQIPPEIDYENSSLVSTSASFSKPSSGAFELKSSDFENNGTIPAESACIGMGGMDVSPQLSWSNAPVGTDSFAVIMDDEACGAGDQACIHWGVFNLDSVVNSLDKGIDISTLEMAVAGKNYMDTNGYAGPCPPNGVHTYKITVYALSEELNLTSEAKYTRSQFESLYASKILGKATIQGIFGQASSLKKLMKKMF